MNNTSPVFIVGLPRSGTTLLTAFLSSHSKLCAGAETHFYNKFVPQYEQRQISSCSESAWAQQSAELFAKIQVSGHSVLTQYGLSELEFCQYLEHQQASRANILSSLLNAFAQKHSKARSVEKTPNHLLHLSAIKEDFPNSPIIFITRDHRDIADSMQALPWAYQSSIANALTINSWTAQYLQRVDSDPSVLRVRFEDLVLQPSTVLTTICDFIEEDFEPQMLARAQAESVADVDAEPWKQQVFQQVDQSKIHAWQGNEDETLYSIIDDICVRYTTNNGYEPITTFEDSQRDKELSLLTTTLQRFTHLDDLAEHIVKAKVTLNVDAPHKLLCFDGKFGADTKLLIKAVLCKIKGQKVYYLPLKTSAVIRLLSKLIFTALE